jgi:hypothetical protein
MCRGTQVSFKSTTWHIWITFFRWLGKTQVSPRGTTWHIRITFFRCLGETQVSPKSTTWHTRITFCRCLGETQVSFKSTTWQRRIAFCKAYLLCILFARRCKLIWSFVSPKHTNQNLQRIWQYNQICSRRVSFKVDSVFWAATLHRWPICEVSKVATVSKVHKQRANWRWRQHILTKRPKPFTQRRSITVQKNGKDRLHRRKNEKTREFDTVYKILRATKICGTSD